MDEQHAAQATDSMRRQILEDALQDVLSQCGAGEGDGCDAAELETLRQTAQVAAALQQLQLCGSSDDKAPSSSGGEAGVSAARFAGAPATRLGVCPADLLAEALPSQARRQAALTVALPALEAELQRRCRLVAAASGYGTDDFTGLPDHLHLLKSTATASQASQAEAWRAALERAQHGVGALAQAARLLADIVREHKLTGQKAADEAHAAALHSECAWLREKLGLVELQLQDQTYTPASVAVLRQVAAEVESTVGQAAAQLKQAAMRLQQYRSLGPGFEALAQEHGGVVQAVEEAEYELREIEQFAQLAAVTG